MIEIPDHYTVLGVGRNATRQEIVHAYRALMRSHHPDLNGGQANGPAVQGLAAQGVRARDDELLRIMQAFNVLRDPGRRADYDRKLAAAPAPNPAPTHVPAPTNVPVRKVRGTGGPSGNIIRVTPVRWESGPWS